MQRLSVCEQYVVGDIDDIVDGMKADGGKLVLEPVGTLLNGDTLDAYAGITRASLGILNVNVNLEILVIYLEAVNIRTVQSGLVTVLEQPCIEITCYAPV